MSAAGGVAHDTAKTRMKSILLFAVIGAWIGGSAGLALAEARDPSLRAEAVIALAPTAQIFEEQDTGPEDATALVQGELIILSGPVLQQDIDRRLEGDRKADYSAAQVGSSTIVNITAEAPTRSGALESLEAVVATYSADREQRLQAEITRAGKVIDDELSRLERALAAAPVGEDALGQEYGRLLSVRSGLFRAAANVDRAVTVVQPPTAVGGGLGSRSQFALLGALLGGLAGVSLLPILRRFRRSERSERNFEGLDVTVLSPEILTHDGQVREFAGNGAHAGGLRMVLSQLVRPEPAPRLVLFGASHGVGTSYLAAAAACSLSERFDVVLVLVSDVTAGGDGAAAHALGVNGAVKGCTTLPGSVLTPADILDAASESDVPGVAVLTCGPGDMTVGLLRRLGSQEMVDACAATGRAVVFDAPVLADSTVTVDLARAAGGAALVVAHSATSRADVVAATEVFTRQGVPLLGVVRNRPARGRSVESAGSRVSTRRRRLRGSIGPLERRLAGSYAAETIRPHDEPPDLAPVHGRVETSDLLLHEDDEREPADRGGRP